MKKETPEEYDLGCAIVGCVVVLLIPPLLIGLAWGCLVLAKFLWAHS